jgi:hypothetical protein
VQLAIIVITLIYIGVEVFDRQFTGFSGPSTNFGTSVNSDVSPKAGDISGSSSAEQKIVLRNNQGLNFTYRDFWALLTVTCVLVNTIVNVATFFIRTK